MNVFFPFQRITKKEAAHTDAYPNVSLGLDLINTYVKALRRVIFI